MKTQKRKAATSVIDLTTESDKEEEEKEVSVLNSNAANDSSSSSNDNAVDVDEDDDEEDDALPARLIASCSATIVGIQYYPGTAHAGEYVTLVREPHNPYDGNAIRVDNLQGEKVGHIKRQQAALMAPFMDNGSVLLEATIPSRGSAYTLPLAIEFFVQQEQQARAAASTDAAQQQQEQELEERATALASAFGRKHSFINHLNPTPQAAKAAKKAAAGPTVESKRMNWDTQAKELDAMFEEQSKTQLKNLPTIAAPSALKTELLPYQQQGLQWLVHQDKTPQLPFYTQQIEKGKKVWHCSITNASQSNEPPSFRGGLLCDEQGLGKTLQMIALMLANPPPPAAVAGSSATATMIVCPVSVMSNWEQQIQQHVQDYEGILRVGFYQGSSRTNLLPQIQSGDLNVVLVSYHTLASEYTQVYGKPNAKKDPPTNKKKQKKISKSIFDIDFHRIILDEAHIIRSTRSRFFHACTQVQTTTGSKWALTGTPIVNKPDDIQALLAFLGVHPLSDKPIYQRAISKPILNGQEEAGMACLRVAMAHVALRRSKTTANIKLADKTVHLTQVSFEDDTPHKALYDALFGCVRVAFEAVLRDGDDKVLRNYTNIFEKLLRLRQACCSAKLVPRERRLRTMQLWNELQQRRSSGGNDDSAPQLTAEEGLALLEKLKGAFEECSNGNELPECAVCLTEMEESQCIILRTCNHVYCEECIGRVSLTNRTDNPNCPLCRQTFTKSDMIKKDVASTAAAAAAAAAQTEEDKTKKQDISMDCDSIGASPKIKALLDRIKNTMKPDEKGVIFSQFTSFLDLIQEAMKDEGHTFTRLDGSMTAVKRVQAIQSFSSEEEGTPRFILCSLHASGTGLNLTRGSVAFMMDCWWNASVENQAMDRIHRIGQKRAVTIHRIVMKNSLEERIVALQEAKSLQAKGAMQKLKPEEQRRARLRDLRGLLKIEDDDE